MALFRHCLKYSYYYTNLSRNILLPTLQVNNCLKTKHVSSYYSKIEDPIVITDDGSTIVCWHPEKEFPYEFTKPLPELVDQQTKSVLKSSEQYSFQVFKKQSPESIREELMKMTYTTKHRWFPRSRDKKAKKTPMDKKYL